MEHEIIKAIKKFNGDREQACALLGISRRTMDRRIAEHDLGEVIQEMAKENGWIGHTAGPRGRIKELLAFMKVHRSATIHDIAKGLYGADGEREVWRVYRLLQHLTKTGKLIATGEGYVLK